MGKRNPIGVKGGRWNWSRSIGSGAWSDVVSIDTYDDRGGSGELLLLVGTVGHGTVTRDSAKHLRDWLVRWIDATEDTQVRFERKPK